MDWILPIVGIVASFFLVRYREQVGNMIGEAEWMKKVGGVYMVVTLFSVFLFFWCLAELTGTNDVLFGGIRNAIPGFTPLKPEYDMQL
jgi:hypothetical protein